MIAQVVFNLPVERAFDYAVPEGWHATLQPGMRVAAPFGSRRLTGTVIHLRATSPIRQLKTLIRVLDASPALNPERLRLAEWLADYYCCSLGQACTSLLPSALRLRPLEEGATPTAVGAEMSDKMPELTEEQRRAFGRLTAALEARRPRTFLLHGITGSGKTELYLRAIALARGQGRSAIVLVPEIALTPQAIDRFRARFGSEVLLWHSRLTARQRAVAWQELASGRRHLVIGTRSAVFAPIRKIGVVILDEEHDPSYKQDQAPRYHAREVALARARLAGAIVILGSATPSVESYYAARRGRFELLELTQRVEGRKLPDVEVIDMRQEFVHRHRVGPFSQRLATALRRIVDLREQAILLLNRRGFARVAQCPACGGVVRCPQCAVPLIYHASVQQMVCHYCNVRQAVPEMCPACHRGYLRLRGAGTERIESELHRLFPASGIARMDTDTTRPRDSHRRLYDAIKTQQIDLLVGTQMVAKGLDIPQVTLVGVVSADTALNLPDFRAGERTFDLLTQVAGRAGRGARPGQVLIQTYCPTHYAIRAASRHDYQAFYQAEIRMRRRLRLPPFVHLIELTVQGSRPDRVQDAAEVLAERLHALAGRRPSRRPPRWRGSAASRGAGGRISLLGPAPHRVVRLRRTTRWCVVLKGPSVPVMTRLLRQVLSEGWRVPRRMASGSSPRDPERRRGMRGLPVIVDVDPL